MDWHILRVTAAATENGQGFPSVRHQISVVPCEWQPTPAQYHPLHCATSEKPWPSIDRGWGITGKVLVYLLNVSMFFLYSCTIMLFY